jgi:hypothetical protein
VESVLSALMAVWTGITDVMLAYIFFVKIRRTQLKQYK